tara:strand:+ start:273 stop:644 length:372 start_codon:yes stop_codon:yes gene_type:complete
MIIFIISLIALILLIITFVRLSNKNRQLNNSTNLVHRFRKKFKGDRRQREKLVEKVADILMTDPNSNIQMSIWDQEDELREKADIHRARLNKYGHSKLNGEEFFLEKNDKVYKYTEKGEKKYV